jgi:hypothetical protein
MLSHLCNLIVLGWLCAYMKSILIVYKKPDILPRANFLSFIERFLVGVRQLHYILTALVVDVVNSVTVNHLCISVTPTTAINALLSYLFYDADFFR